MMTFLRKYRQTIMVLTVVFFLGGIFVGFGSYFFSSNPAMGTVAEVNGAKIPYQRYLMTYRRTIDNLRNSEAEVTDALLEQKKQEILQDLIQEEVFFQETKKYGIEVPDGELAADIANFDAFKKNGVFDKMTYLRVLQYAFRLTPEEFESSRRRTIAIIKLRQIIAGSLRTTDQEMRYEYARRNSGKMDKYEKDKETFRETVTKEKVSLVFNEWFRQLGQNVKVKVHLNEIEKGRG